MTENQVDQDKERDNFIAHVKQLTESQFNDEQCYLVYDIACLIKMASSLHNPKSYTPLNSVAPYAIGVYQICKMNLNVLTNC